MTKSSRAGTERLQAELAKQILAATKDASEAAKSFAKQASADSRADELPELTTEEIAANLADFWAFGARRRGRSPHVRVEPVIGDQSAGLDRLEIVQDDCPFLVDSVMGEIADQGLSVRAMVHPIVDIARDSAGVRGEGQPRRESMIHVILDPVGVDREAALQAGVMQTLGEVRAAVDDFQEMLALLGRTLAELKTTAPVGKVSDEEIAFLSWLQAEQFVFLGARTYEYPIGKDGDYIAEEPLYKATDGLGVLRDTDRQVLRRANEPAILTGEVQARLRTDPAVMVAKSNLRSRVHRRGYMDYVGVKRYGADGRATGEVRFVGLFTAAAYDQPAAAVPLIRAKVARVLERAAAAPGSHNEKRLKNIVENQPRDELFQMTEDELLAQSLGVLHLYDRPKVKLFERRDPLDRFASVLLFLPRDQFDSDVADRAGAILADAYRGRISALYPTFSDAPLARVHYIIGFTPGAGVKPDLKVLEGVIAEAARSWEDHFDAAVRASGREPEAVVDTLEKWRGAFPAGYRDRFTVQQALSDIAVIEGIERGEGVEVRAYRTEADSTFQFRFKLYSPGQPAALSDVLPILDNMSLKALAEAGFPVTPKGGETTWVHDFEMEDPRGDRLVFAEIKPVFQDAVAAVWRGEAENDGFNRLVMELSLTWREASLVRALARYRSQSGLDPTQRVQEQALAAHGDVTSLILRLFHTRFDPALGLSLDERQAQGEALMADIIEALQAVASLDDDRVLRRMALLVASSQRTNFYQVGEDGSPKPYISFKVASGELADLPAPKPFREIFVCAINVEGVHLRFGPVARGGLRWSDRRDDFRTEVLGLVKAQQVKNAVIVPVGSKGGFYAKQAPKSGGPEAIRAAGVRAYQTFLKGLLDITDNLDAEGRVVRPQNVIAHDGDDPYLVVAADKGTATFSDIANGVAEDYGFWLGDAFASGGSAGYDHKAMGITARGAWEAVKRHFRELGKDIQTEPFTVIGVGDMSGDVFGNGMLLSRQTKLTAAFDHRHIFLDPDPDPKASFAERQRMFALPRSSWDDYDRKVISKGGGVFARSLKSVPLSAEARALLGVSAETLSPAELMTAILKSPAELLYLGGIGTYVKASREANADVGDKANDAIRIDASDLRVKVVGEGANLGVTQAARIEYATLGGRIETDAIDNSAGVDTSDHEVNIKILTGMLERSGELTRKRRDTVLASMTDEIASHVLAHNYSQTLALSLMEMDAAGELEPHAEFMAALEAEGRLDRKVEGLPSSAQILERKQAGRGLTRPELSVLLAYGKLELKREMAGNPAPDDPWFEAALIDYFPKAMHKWREPMLRHRLRRDIIATVLANDIIDRCGPSFPARLMAAAACDLTGFVAAYEAAKALIGLETLWARVASLDGKAPAAAQMALFRRIGAALRGATFWLARRAGRESLSVGQLNARYGDGFKAVQRLLPDALSPADHAAVAARRDELTALGAPEDLAMAAAILQPLTLAADLVDLAEASSWPTANVARLYHAAGAAFGFDKLREAAGSFAAGDAFERVALRRLIEDMLAEQAQVTQMVMAFCAASQAGAQAGERAKTAADAVSSWAALQGERARGPAKALEDIAAGGGDWTFAKLTIANAAMRELATPPPPTTAKRRR
ncbi:NAD-glutamate dehydrogenase [Phenylobacterium immobile]|uniref:NAD-glutamate dehydrogenase n=1 Tax=Phenylobacterium immobile TaxID=21 RepID=UPI000A45795A|nr:NAD-glutamate dehydrogenase [Phenylobacterium immobile]